MSGSKAQAFEAAIAAGEVVLFPSDTVYGLACDPTNPSAIGRLYGIKQRPVDKSAAVMFFDLAAALAALPDLGERTVGALAALLPGPLTVLLRNPERRFPLANRADPETLGLRVVKVPELLGVRTPVLQSSANPSGGADQRTLAAVAPAVRAGVNLEIDGGELPGRASTVVDLRGYEGSGTWLIVRQGAISEQELAGVLHKGSATAAD